MEIKLYDGYDEWGWPYYIGYGPLSASEIIPQIEAAKGQELIVRINSSGGLVFDGWAIYNALKDHGNVTIKIDAIAASIASIIAMAGNKVIIAEAALMMVHKPSTIIINNMDADSLKKEADILDKIQVVLNGIYAAKTGLDEKTVDSLINEETWLTPTDAITLGFVDEIAGQPQDAPLSENTFNQLFKNADAKIRAYAKFYLH